MKIKKLCIFISTLILLLFWSCQKEEFEQPFTNSDFISTGDWQGEYWPTDGWRTCCPEELGMDSEKLRELNEEVQILLKLHIDVQNIIIVKDGYIVAEQYYNDDYDKDSLHRIYSCTKSITSALLGISIDRGFIKDLNARMIDFFPEYELENLTPEKQQITLEHLLTMSAGLEWYEMEYYYNDDRNTYRSFVESENQVKFVLDRPTVAAPGEEYSYNTGISHVLSAIIKKASGMRADSLALEYLFKPLGIKNYNWPVDAQGISYGGNGVQLTPRDLAKFGYLYLKNGMWNNNRIVSESWVTISQQKHIARKYIPDYYYGYHWWVSNKNYYSAVGFAGQWLIIVPEHNLVVVFNNQFKDGDNFQLVTPERLLSSYIIPAIK